MKFNLEISVPLGGIDLDLVTAWLDEAKDVDQMIKQALLDVVREYPMIVRVGGEVWHSVDLTSIDTHSLEIRFPNGVDASSDNYELLSDFDEVMYAVVAILEADNVCSANIKPLDNPKRDNI